MSHPTIDLGWRIEVRQLLTAHPGRLLGYAQRSGDGWTVVVRDGSTEHCDDKYQAAYRLASLVTARYGEPVGTGTVVEPEVTAASVERVERVELADANPVVAELVAALRLLGVDGPAVARDLLDVAPAQLTDRELAAVLGWLGHRERPCARCGLVVEFVTEGPDPGWWRHREVPGHPHPAVPEVTR